MDVHEIKLPCGRIAFVDEADWPAVSEVSWSTNGQGYVRGRLRVSGGGSGRSVYLHRFLLNPPAGSVVDHIDRNPLNNTRANLQVVTASRNLMRRGGGVTWMKDKRLWRVRLRVDGKLTNYGTFYRREDADARLTEVRAKIWGDSPNVF